MEAKLPIKIKQEVIDFDDGMIDIKLEPMETVDVQENIKSEPIETENVQENLKLEPIETDDIQENIKVEPIETYYVQENLKLEPIKTVKQEIAEIKSVNIKIEPVEIINEKIDEPKIIFIKAKSLDTVNTQVNTQVKLKNIQNNVTSYEDNSQISDEEEREETVLKMLSRAAINSKNYRARKKMKALNEKNKPDTEKHRAVGKCLTSVEPDVSITLNTEKTRPSFQHITDNVTSYDNRQISDEEEHEKTVLNMLSKNAQKCKNYRARQKLKALKEKTIHLSSVNDHSYAGSTLNSAKSTLNSAESTLNSAGPTLNSAESTLNSAGPTLNSAGSSFEHKRKVKTDTTVAQRMKLYRQRQKKQTVKEGSKALTNSERSRLYRQRKLLRENPSCATNLFENLEPRINSVVNVNTIDMNAPVIETRKKTNETPQSNNTKKIEIEVDAYNKTPGLNKVVIIKKRIGETHTDCYTCNNIFKSTNAPNRPYKCDICDRCFSEKRSFELHSRLHTVEKQVDKDDGMIDVKLEPTESNNVQENLQIEDVSIKLEPLVMKNEIVNESEIIFVKAKPINTVNYQARSIEKLNLELHSGIHTVDKNFKCDICLKSFSRKAALMKHARLHSKENPYKCDICGKVFSCRSRLNSHIRTHTGENPYKCDVCNKCFNFKSALINHSRVHTGEKPFQCDICQKCFSRKSALVNHVLMHSKDSPYRCGMCPKSFIDENSLIEHIRVHTEDKPYRCEVCEKNFASKNHLNSHRRTHTGEKPYKCNVCNKCFSYKNVLNDHSRIHTGEKPYKCDICNKCFSYKNVLNDHIRMHTGERPFKCNICDKTFCQKSSLNTHSRLHSGKKPFKCEICDKNFNYKNVLKKHIQKIHGSHLK